MRSPRQVLKHRGWSRRDGPQGLMPPQHRGRSRRDGPQGLTPPQGCQHSLQGCRLHPQLPQQRRQPPKLRPLAAWHLWGPQPHLPGPRPHGRHGHGQKSNLISRRRPLAARHPQSPQCNPKHSSPRRWHHQHNSRPLAAQHPLGLLQSHQCNPKHRSQRRRYNQHHRRPLKEQLPLRHLPRRRPPQHSLQRSSLQRQPPQQPRQRRPLRQWHPQQYLSQRCRPPLACLMRWSNKSRPLAALAAFHKKSPPLAASTWPSALVWPSCSRSLVNVSLRSSCTNIMGRPGSWSTGDSMGSLIQRGWQQRASATKQQGGGDTMTRFRWPLATCRALAIFCWPLAT